MGAEIWKWLVGVVTSAGVLGLAAYLLRETVAKFFSKAVEHRFEKKLEEFKSTIRDNEKELDQIRSFLVSARRERDSSLQAKRFDAAESLLRARQSLSQFSMLVEYMKILNSDRILGDGDDPKITDFIETLLNPFDLDSKLKELNSEDRTISRLYLSDKTIKAFEAYQSIILQAAMMMKLFSLPLRNKGQLLKPGHVSKAIIELVPHSKVGFDTYGEDYAYHWSSYFHDEILRLLRLEVSGSEDLDRNTKAIEQLALDSRQAQINIRASLNNAGLPETLIRTAEGIAADQAVVEQAAH